MDWTSIVDDQLLAIRKTMAERHARELARHRASKLPVVEDEALTQRVKRMIEEARP